MHVDNAARIISNEFRKIDALFKLPKTPLDFGPAFDASSFTPAEE